MHNTDYAFLMLFKCFAFTGKWAKFLRAELETVTFHICTFNRYLLPVWSRFLFACPAELDARRVWFDDKMLTRRYIKFTFLCLFCVCLYWSNGLYTAVDMPKKRLHISNRIPEPQMSVDNNYYIKNLDYKHRLNNDIYSTASDPFWQLPVYIFAAETCRLTNCKTIIDIGCEQATKLNNMPNNVRKIGVDVEGMIKMVKDKFKHIDFLVNWPRIIVGWIFLLRYFARLWSYLQML